MEESIRPELVAFVRVMETRLKENANRGDWRALNFYYLVSSMASNVGQLVRAFQVDKTDAVLRAAADTANYAMMIADLYGGLAAKKK
jgi:hypothetical protein